MDIAKRIIQLCEQHKITPHHLAVISGVPYSTIGQLITNPNRDPQVGTIRKICVGLGIDLTEFFTPEKCPDLPPEAIKELKLYEEYLRAKYKK